MANHLQGQTSPYLRQHADNPVDWYPWCEEAFEKAKREDKPIFLSIGYSTCHWCHVMAHESFEDQEVADLLNQGFVSIKVDREERPDIDSLYMAVCQAFTGSGGWPTTLFLSPDQKPFFAGTYFPKESQRGMPGMLHLLPSVLRAWKEDRDKLLAPADQVISLLQEDKPSTAQPPDDRLLLKALSLWRSSYDPVCGGFGSAPKFPMGHNLLCLLTCGEKLEDPTARAMAEKTLEQLYRGGIFDHIGGGFSRYSTDRQFLIPHFEKMLYDNALLMLAYCKAYSLTKRELYKEVALKTADYVLRELTLPSGAFASAQDADSQGQEGSYYVFRPDEILQVLGQRDGEIFNQCYHISPQGNFEGKNIPNLLAGDTSPERCADFLPKLRAYRQQRYQLHRDDKVLTSWNGLMIAAMAWLYRITGEVLYLKAAQRAWAYLEQHHRQGDDLFASSLGDQTGPKGFLEDYAFLSFGLLTLYEVTLEKYYLEQAQAFCRKVRADFADQERGGFYLTAKDSDPLLIRPKETADGAIPSGNTVLAYVLVRLSHLTRDTEWTQAAQQQLSFLAGQANTYPTAYPMYLLALLEHAYPPEEITVTARSAQDLPQQPWPFPLDAVVTFYDSPTDAHPLINDQTTYAICRGNTCLPLQNHYLS